MQKLTITLTVDSDDADLAAVKSELARMLADVGGRVVLTQGHYVPGEVTTVTVDDEDTASK